MATDHQLTWRPAGRRLGNACVWVQEWVGACAAGSWVCACVRERGRRGEGRGRRHPPHHPITCFMALPTSTGWRHLPVHQPPVRGASGRQAPQLLPTRSQLLNLCPLLYLGQKSVANRRPSAGNHCHQTQILLEQGLSITLPRRGSLPWPHAQHLHNGLLWIFTTACQVRKLRFREV